MSQTQWRCQWCAILDIQFCPATSSVDVREGFDCLQIFLLPNQKQETGITASSFSVTVKSDMEKLHHMASYGLMKIFCTFCKI